MTGVYGQGMLFRTAAGGIDPATARLRTEQMLRAVREAAKLGGVPPPRVVGLSGQILEDDDPGGDGARVIEVGDARNAGC
jgi:hypothetical protein